MYQRLDEIGIDFAIALPDLRAHAIHLCRRRAAPSDVAARSTSISPRSTRPIAIGSMPVACIPTFTPEEAVAELEHAVGTLGLKSRDDGRRDPAALSRAIDGTAGRPLDRRPRSRFDPTTTPRCGQSASSSGSRRRFTRPVRVGARRASPTNYVFNHIGNFAAAGELSRALAVLRRRADDASRSCGSRSSKAARRGPATSSATSSATARSATGTRSDSYDPAALDR